jgi:hypothetical protein
MELEDKGGKLIKGRFSVLSTLFNTASSVASQFHWDSCEDAGIEARVAEIAALSVIRFNYSDNYIILS